MIAQNIENIFMWAADRTIIKGQRLDEQNFGDMLSEKTIGGTLMLRISKKLVSAALAVSLASVISVAASADTIDFNTPTASHSWNVRSIGGGAPSSADRSERFYLLYSRLGATGNCETLTSRDTTFGVRLSCVDELHTIIYHPMEEDMFGKYIVWNGEGTKKWTYVETNGNDVRYRIGAYGLNTYSTGSVSRV